MKRIYVLSLLFFAIGCSKKEKNIKFNQISYYHLEISDNAAESILMSKNFKGDDYLFQSVFNFDYPETLNNPNFERILAKRYQKVFVPKKSYREIEKALYYISPDSAESALCEPYYRDILIFRQNNKVTGIAKLCFKCGQNQTIGIDYDPEKKWLVVDCRALEKVLSSTNR